MKKLPTSVIYSAICLVIMAIVAMSYVVRKTSEEKANTQTGEVMTGVLSGNL